MFSFTAVQRKNEAKKCTPSRSRSNQDNHHHHHHRHTNNNDREIGLNVSKTGNRKRLRRAQRRRQLKSHIETNTTWKMKDHADDDVDVDAKQQSGASSSKTAMNVSSLFESLQETEQEIAKEQKKKACSNPRRQLKADQMNLVQLFKNEQFGADPLKFTTEIIERQNNMQSQHIEWNNPNDTKKTTRNKRRRNRGGSTAIQTVNSHASSSGGGGGSTRQNNGRGGQGERMNANDRTRHCNDDQLKTEIAKQLSLTKMKKQNSTNVKMKEPIKKLKASSRSAGGKIQKKLRKKMSQFAKDNQKKRRWRI